MADAARWLHPLLELAYPEHCARCGAARHETPWSRAGRRCAGLRCWDQPHLCRSCERHLEGEPLLAGRVAPDGLRLPVAAARATSAELVELVGAWKYHGLRGLAWPLARLLVPAAALLPEAEHAVLVPVPLHRRRRRARGFNQAEVLARLLAEPTGLEIDTRRLRRTRATRQQARLQEDDQRRRNLADAFRARPAPGADRRECILVDDLVTSGATLLSAALALRRQGWLVVGALTLGVARGGRSPDPAAGPSG